MQFPRCQLRVSKIKTPNVSDFPKLHARGGSMKDAILYASDYDRESAIRYARGYSHANGKVLAYAM